MNQLIDLILMIEMVDVWTTCTTHLVMDYLVRNLSKLFWFIYIAQVGILYLNELLSENSWIDTWILDLVM